MALSLDFMHWIDRYVGRLVITALQPFNLRAYRATPPSLVDFQPRRILIVKFWGIGSIALAGPTVTALREQYPDAEFFFLTLAGNRAFMEHLPAIDHVITLDIQGGAGKVATRTLRLLRALRRHRFDLVVDLEFFTRFSALVSFFTGAPVRVGFHAWEVFRGRFHNIRVPFNRYWHVTENFFNLGRAAGVTRESPPRFRLSANEAAGREVEQALEVAGVQGEERVVLFNPNAGDLALERRWPPAYFARLARVLSDETGIRPVFIGAPGERDYVTAVVAESGPAAVNLAGALSVGGLIRLLDRAEALITNDTGPLQLALTQDLPTLSFFGPETPVLYGPRQGRHRVLYRHLACSPCINVHSQKKVRCIFGHPICLESIPVERAAREARALLAGEAGPLWAVNRGHPGDGGAEGHDELETPPGPGTV